MGIPSKPWTFLRMILCLEENSGIVEWLRSNRSYRRAQRALRRRKGGTKEKMIKARLVWMTDLKPGKESLSL